MLVFDKDEATRAFLTRRQSLQTAAKEIGVGNNTLRRAILGQVLMPEPAAKISAALNIEPVWVNGTRRRKDSP